jgi:2-polyprenyl-6-methoxyphenol hydroxylase-like FAD-dependent oxidoreductase
MHVIIIGAGTGGLCLAHGLKRAGISVAVYERDRTRTDGLQGYRVGLSPAGSAALHACLPPDLFDTFVATCARGPRWFNILTEHMDELLSIASEDDGDPVRSEKSVSRMTLRQVLLTGLDDIVHFDKTLTMYIERPDGKVVAMFSDGTEAVGDVLVGADGTGSRVRQQKLPHAILDDTGIRSIGGKVPVTPETKALLTDKILHGVTMVMAPRGYGAIVHVMEFPWRRGTNDAAMLARWPGMMFDNTRDYIMWGFWAATDRFRTDPSDAPRDALLPMAQEMTQDWHPHLRELIQRSDASTIFPIKIRTSVPLDPWPTSRTTLLGDAIHTMTPGRGIGANTALKDAQLLCNALVAVRDKHSELLPAIHAYEVEMIRYGFEAVIDSRKQFDANSPIHKPVVGRFVLAATRGSMRFVNRVPMLKRRIMAKARANR